MDIKEVIANDLAIPGNLIDEAISAARAHVKIFKIKKRSGESREIFHPSKKTKTIQYWLIHTIFNEIKTHSSSMAYREGISILNNAEKHRSNRFFLKMDLKNFFPSISYNDLRPHLKEWHSSKSPQWDFNNEAEEIIRRVCFYKNDRLATGYPSSPIISNIVMKNFDSAVCQAVSDENFGDVVYTRYADDLIFSTNKKGACLEIQNKILNIINKTQSPNIKVNHAKTKLASSSGGSASVTGLKVCENGHLTIHRKQKDHIRLLLSLYQKGRLDDKEQASLAGHLAYCHYVAPDFYTKLSKKYFKEMYKLSLENY